MNEATDTETLSPLAGEGWGEGEAKEMVKKSGIRRKWICHLFPYAFTDQGVAMLSSVLKLKGEEL